MNESSDHALVVESINIMRKTLVPNIIFILLGTFAVIMNILTMYIIITSNSLKTKCFVLLGANSCSDFLIGAGYLMTGSIRVYRHVIGNGELVSMWKCLFEVLLIILAQLLSLGMAIALVIDRLLAVFCAHKYKIWTYSRVTVPLIGFAYSFAAFQIAIHVQNAWRGREIILKSCGIEDTLFPETLSRLTSFQISISCAVVVLNCILALGVWRQKKNLMCKISHNPQRNAQEMAAMKKEVRTIKTITVIVALHICSHLGGRLAILIINSLSTEFEDDDKALTNRYGRQAVVLNAAVHFFVLFSMSTNFRTATKRIFCKVESSSPHPMAS